MNELLNWLKENNFQIDVPDLDERFHRFNRDGKKNGWLWGARTHLIKTAAEIITVRVGDWKTGEIFEYNSGKNLSREDKKVLDTKLKEMAVKAKKLKEIFHAETKDIAAEILSHGQDGEHDYLTRKQIPEIMEGKIVRRSIIDNILESKNRFNGNENILCIPMRDIEGTLWGLQRIDSKCQKYFLPGQKVDGCFHTIPADANLLSDEPVYVCEGFSTAASVRLAINGIVIVAFNAGNLESVCKAIRKDAPEKPIIVCGDDDSKGSLADGTPYNIGRDKAEAAAKAVIGRAVFPKFRSDKDGPTDFNDLHVREGIDEVKKQIFAVKAEKNYVRFLGHREGYYYYTSSSNKEIVAIKTHTSTELLNLMPKAYWETLYVGKNGIDWTAASDGLMQSCRAVGTFTADKVRGLGIWFDDGAIVVHLGDRLSVNGKEVGIHDIKSRYIYELAPIARSIHKSPLTLEGCRPIHDVLNLLSFERPEQKLFLGGWIIAARLSGILQWRPHLWVTGESGSGKSTVLNEFIKPLLGQHKKQFAGGTTEAGMRQSVKSHAVPVIFDEFEPDSIDAAQRVKSCIEFIRQASTDSGHIVKGSTQGNSVEYKSRFCAVVSSIQTLLNKQADRTRFTVAEIKKIKNNPEQWVTVQSALEKICTEEFSDRLFSRIVLNAQSFQDNSKLFAYAFAGKHSQRLGQQYGPLLAGWALLNYEGVLTAEQVEEVISQVDLEQEGAASSETDQQDCLQHLLHKRISVAIHDLKQDMTVGALVQCAKTDEYANIQLAGYGMKIVHSTPKKPIPGGVGFFVSNNNPQLSQIFYGTAWHSGWINSLSRLPMSIKGTQHRLSGPRTRGVVIPMLGVIDQLDAE